MPCSLNGPHEVRVFRTQERSTMLSRSPQLFRNFHVAYTDMFCNPFYAPGTKIKSKSVLLTVCAWPFNFETYFLSSGLSRLPSRASSKQVKISLQKIDLKSAGVNHLHLKLSPTVFFFLSASGFSQQQMCSDTGGNAHKSNACWGQGFGVRVQLVVGGGGGGEASN